jgi:hypothetical protein
VREMTFAELLARLDNVRGTGDKRTARCVAHPDHDNSLSISSGSDGRVLVKCFAGCDVDAICAALGIEVKDLFPSKEPKPGRERKEAAPSKPLTLAELAETKRLPVDWLREQGLDDFPDGSGVAIAYYDENENKHLRLRKRTALRAKEGSIWLGPRGVALIAYGVWRLGDARKNGDLILVEGETDALSIWFHNLAALGLPGASMAKTLEAKYLDGIKRIFVHHEPDRAGEIFVSGVTSRLCELEFAGDVKEFSIDGFKDPSELHIADPVQFRERFDPALETAVPINLELIRLASLSTFDYEKERKEAAKKLGVRPLVLDAEVGKHRTASRSEPSPKKESPAWAPPQKLWTESVDGRELVAELTAAIRRFVLLDQIGASVAALWVLFTWLFEHIAETNPFLRIVSPTPQCGKSTLLKVLRRLCRHGWIVARISASSFTRTMSSDRRTLLLDEGDAFLHENEIMRNVLDGASDPDTATTSMSVKSGDEWKPAEFNVFVPIGIASIGTLRKMQTVEDRSIAIQLKRATPAELKQLAKGRKRELDAVLGPLAEKCARWAADNAGKLKGSRPELPDILSGREQDKWEPLVAIADAISPEAGEAARFAATNCSGATGADAPIGVALISDIRRLFDANRLDRFSSQTMCEELAALDEDRPWAEYGKTRKPLSKNQLARLLRPFSITPRTVRLPDGSTPKGYQLSDFEDAFARYLGDLKSTDAPIFGDRDRHTATAAGRVRQTDDFQSATEVPCGGSKNSTSPNAENGCGVVAVQNDLNGCAQQISNAEIDRLAAEDGWIDSDGGERF